MAQASTQFRCSNGGLSFVEFIFNADGTINGLTSDENPITFSGHSLGYECCMKLSSEYPTLNIEWDGTYCRWIKSCDLTDSYKLILSPEEDSGALFDVDENEECFLEVSFDYILLFDCSKLTACLEGSTNQCNVVSILSGIQLTTTVEMVTAHTETNGIYYQNPTTYNTIYSEIFFNPAPDFATYLLGNTNTGYLLTGDCTNTINCILTELGDNCYVVSANTFNSGWVHYDHIITDPATLDLIKMHKIKIGVQVNGCACDFSLLMDNLKINKLCTETETVSTVVNTVPGFTLTRIKDNKKSWLYLEEPDVREYGLTMRDTNYGVNHSKLVINTKEVDIGLDGASAIECNVFDYLQNNDCILNNQLCTDIQCALGGTVNILNSEFTYDLSYWSYINFLYSASYGGTARLNAMSGNLISLSAVLTEGVTYIFTYNYHVGSKIPFYFNIILGTNESDIYELTDGSGSGTIILTCTGGTDLIIECEKHGEGGSFYLLDVKLEYYVPEFCISGETINTLLITPFSSITTSDEFIDVIETELIDVKDRKVLSAYPTLRYLYDAYNNPEAFGCTADSRHYNYCMLNRFVNLIGSYWVDIIEQVIPSTTIWGASYVYRNTIFDQPKFKYKRGSLFYCFDVDACDEKFKEFYEQYKLLISYASCDCSSVDITEFLKVYENAWNEFDSCFTTWYDEWSVTHTISDECDIAIKKLLEEYQTISDTVDDTFEILDKYLVDECPCDVKYVTDYVNAINDVIQIRNEIVNAAAFGCSTTDCPIIGYDSAVSVEVTEVSAETSTVNCVVNEVIPTPCLGVYIRQVDDGSEFYGSVFTSKVGGDVVVIHEKPPTGPPIVEPPPEIEYEACLYELPDHADWVSAASLGGVVDTFYFDITSLIVDGVEYIGGAPETLTVLVDELNWVPCNNNVIRDEVKGWTYTNFVDWGNSLLLSLGITNLKFQLATGMVLGGTHGLEAGFYIVRPVGTTFSIETSVPDTFRYTETGLTWWDGGEWIENIYYNVYSCSGFTLNGDIVVEPPVIPVPIEYEACWYALPETSDWIMTKVIGEPSAVFNFELTQLTVDSGVTTLYPPLPSTAITASDFHWITSNNNVVSGTTTGLTYTDFVDWGNSVLLAHNQPNITLQISTGSTINNFSGFFIIRPVGTTFMFSIDTDFMKRYYTETTMGEYYGSELLPMYPKYQVCSCTGITMNGNAVIE